MKYRSRTRRFGLAILAASLLLPAQAVPSQTAVSPSEEELHGLTAVHTVLPDYPQAALRGRIKGRVQLEGIVDQNGRVRELACIDCPSDSTGFVNAAVAAIETWSYQPARNPDGSPVSVSITFDVRFIP